MIKQKNNWWKEGVVYQIYPRSFYDSNGDGIGDLQGIIKKLDYLKELGVTILWLNPVYKSPNVDNGYDISDYQDIMDEFGTIADWEQLLAEVHKRGMKLILDLVVNHTSDQHPWFIESRSAKNNPYRDYYIWRPGKAGKEPNNWATHFFGSAWQYDKNTDEYYLHLFTPEQPDLNWENPKVRQEIYQMMRWWLDKGIDGFRMDTINMISKVPGFPDVATNNKDDYIHAGKYFLNGPRIHEFLQEMYQQVLVHYDIMTVGECPGVTVDDVLLYTKKHRKELNTIFQFDLMEVDNGAGGRWNPIPWRLTDFKKIITRWQQGLHGQGWNANFLMNHDQPRAVSRFANDKKYRIKSACMLATLTLTLEGTPYIYQGEEIGMTNVQFDDIDNYQDIETLNFYKEAKSKGLNQNEIMKMIHYQSRDNSRTPMQWDNTENAGFTLGTPWIQVNPNYSGINVKKDRASSDSIYRYYQKMIEIRKNNPALIYGEYVPMLEDDESLFIYQRILGQQKFLIILNFSQNTANFALPNDETKLVICNYENADAKMRPYEARIYIYKT
jgi:oligo-1,6-glucosidase